MAPDSQPLLSPQRNQSNSSNIRRRMYRSIFCQVCRQHKAIIIILALTVIVGELNALLQLLNGDLIEEFVPISEKKHIANSETSPIAIVCALLAVVAMLYPVGGFIADVCCGRFKTVIAGLTFMLISVVCIMGTLLGWASLKHRDVLIPLNPLKDVAPFYVFGLGSIPFLVLGLAAYQSNFIQLGLDQLSDAPSIHLSVFIHLAIWSDMLGRAIMTFSGAVVLCKCQEVNKLYIKIPLTAPSILFMSCFPFLVVLSCCKRHWFNTEPSHRNPYRNVINVLNYVRKHDYPRLRSAFTYTGNERPSRMDYAKERYGGPFTTEQVEDVRTFLKMLGLLFSIGSIFIMEIQNSFVGFTNFGWHTGYREDFINRCKVWMILESSFLKHLIAVAFLPVYIHRFVYVRRSSIFARMFAGLLLYILGTLSMLAIDLAGHLHYVNDQDTGSHCMFTYTRANREHSLKYPVLEMHWAVLILPNILLGVGPPILLCTIFEFISAQSPHSMKGLLVGVFYTIKGFYQLISSIALIPISSDRIWARGRMREHPPVTNCCFVYFLFTFVVALVGVIVSSVVVKRYKYRERDDRPYDQSVVEEIFDRRNRMRSPTPDYDIYSDA